MASLRRALRPWLLQNTSSATFSAAALHLQLSERTLSRRLAEQGLSFRLLLDDVRQEKAMRAIQALPVATLAAELGYAGARPFQRAFKRWTGLTPKRFLGRDTSRHAAPKAARPASLSPDQECPCP